MSTQVTDCKAVAGTASASGRFPVGAALSALDDSGRDHVMGGEGRGDDLDHTGQHPLYRSMESRRAYPRVKLRLPVQVGLGGGRVVCARIYNMSPDGVQIRCEPPTALAINPSGRAISPGDGPVVLVAVRLDAGRDVRTHVLRCRVSYVLPESPNEVIIGLSFEDLRPEQRAAIDSVMGMSLMPRDA